MANIHINSDNIEYTSESIISKYVYQTTSVNVDKSRISVKPVDFDVTFKTKRNVSKLGIMLVGWGGNNGSTFTGAHLANKHKISWMTKSGVKEPNWFGSVLQSSTVSLGFSQNGEIYVPMRDMLPMVDPNDIIIDGWDISSLNLAEAMKRAEVFDYDLQRQLIPHMEGLKPRAAVHRPDFVAANQSERADNVVLLDHAADQVTSIRNDIKDFKSKHDVDTVIVLWTANTERFCDIIPGIHDTAENLMNSVKRNEAEISTSTIYAIASILEGCSYINGSPQNTFVPGVIELAEQYNVFLGGDDFKSGQTKIKSVLVDFLVSAGIKPVSIVSYNHLGNNDGKNLSAPKQFRSKEISKSNVVDDMVESNDILYGKDEKPDHVVVIKYVPAVGDSKRAMDEYISEILMHGTNTLAIHNTCEDSLLATPIILDLVLLTELCQRVQIKVGTDGEYQNFNTILSLLSYLLKAPLVPKDTPLVNALFKQRAAIENIMRAMLSLPAQNHMLLEYKLADMSVFQKDLQMKNIQTIEKYNSCMKVPKSKIENGLYTNVLNSAIH
ncbi:inositol-3-phosphate synthase 1-A [Hydra vulgaris]|uniref:inositol-3-phosphate synthase 1-A n=1 Tax=Hydra vulgaris TaxID=6087 RepID=UPI001F5E47FE|nr:inositol-3-phosphate synthase 1-A [Hydra vulgaris]